MWAIIEAEDGGLFRSDDFGDRWEVVSRDPNLRQRPWYYHHVFADPNDGETVWVLNTLPWRSKDGGRSFARVVPPHVDTHDLWIDPVDSNRMIMANDGGGTVTYDSGESWSSQVNQPTAELYHVVTDSQVPYRIYGAQQDNTTISIPSRSNGYSITEGDTEEVGGGESGTIAVRRDDPNIVYATSYHGYLTRWDRRSGEMRNVMVWPEVLAGYAAKDARYRFAWTSPVVLSAHDQRVLYACGNHVFRSDDEGMHWTEISPDLTRNDPKTQGPSGGPITKDNTGAEVYGTVFAFAESAREKGVLWAGSDDGLLHVSRTAGQSWRQVTPPLLPRFALISVIEPSPHSAGVAYVVATRYKLNDFKPYVFKTSNYGKTWSRITDGLPSDVFVRVIREDPVRRGLLYLGTETGIYVSFDDGRQWHSWRSNLPVVPVHDLVIKDADLIAATHGRSFWIFGALNILREWPASSRPSRDHLFVPPTTIRFVKNPDLSPLRTVSPLPPITPGINYRWSGPALVPFRGVQTPDGRTQLRPVSSGTNPEDGVAIHYYLKSPAPDVSIVIRDVHGRKVRGLTANGRAGLNVVVWDLRYDEASRVDNEPAMVSLERAIRGPFVVPGRYEVSLHGLRSRMTAHVGVLRDPRTSASNEDLAAQCKLLLELREKLSQTHEAINQIRMQRRELEEWRRRAQGRTHRSSSQVASTARRLVARLDGIEDELIQTKAKSHQDVLNYPIKLNARLGGLKSFIAQADGRPTASAYEVFAATSKAIDLQLRRLNALQVQVEKFSDLAQRTNIPALHLTGVPESAQLARGKRPRRRQP